jgi:hypothetical protein
MKKKKSHALTIVQKFFPHVTEVVDANHPLEVEVTQKDSDQSRKKNHAHCALAQACERKLHADGAIVSIRAAYVIKGNKAVRYRVPEATAREVISFDRNAGFQPGAYRLTAPNPSNKLGRMTGTHKVTGTRPKHQRHMTQNVRANLLSHAT